jgi:hypothetical protein
MKPSVTQQRYCNHGCIPYLLMAVGFVAGVLAAIAWFNMGRTQYITIGISLGSLAIGFTLLKWVHRLEARHDPNAERLDERKKLATDRAMSLEDYDEIQQERAREVYEEYVKASKTRSSRREEPFAEPEQLVIDWWVVPSLFLYGGTLTIKLSEKEHATVFLPEDEKPASVLDLATRTKNVLRFQVRVLAINTHPDEQRDE